jgi:hypothetical protein
VQRFRSAPILLARIRFVGNQEFGNRPTECRGGHVKSCVAGIEVMIDLREKEGRCLVSCGAHGRRCRGKSRTGGQVASYGVNVAAYDEVNEVKKSRITRSSHRSFRDFVMYGRRHRNRSRIQLNRARQQLLLRGRCPRSGGQLFHACGRKYSTIAAPIDARRNPTYSIGLISVFGGWMAIARSTLTMGAPPKTSGMT